MRYRKLRIAWSVVCSIACVLLIVLWVRSYWIVDLIQKGTGSKSVNVYIEPGTIGVGILAELNPNSWTRSSMTADRYHVVVGTHPPRSSRVWGYSHFATNALFLPFWFLVLLASTLVTVPWLRWRFTLRILLIATTLVAVVLGLIVGVRRP
jgi:hypothetical protein